MAFTIVVASFTFPSFLPSRRHRDDQHDAKWTAGTAADRAVDCRDCSWSWMLSSHSRLSASKEGTACFFWGVGGEGGASCVTPVRTTKTHDKPTSVAFLLYSPMSNNRGKQPSEHEDQINRKKMFLGYIVNKLYTSDLNITNENTVSSVVTILGQ